MMRFPDFRFTVRRLMVAVAIVGVVLAIWVGLERRRARFERLFSYHNGLTGPAYRRSFDPFRPGFRTAKGRWHHELSQKYGLAARNPWLPVAPDPPEPN